MTTTPAPGTHAPAAFDRRQLLAAAAAAAGLQAIPALAQDVSAAAAPAVDPQLLERARGEGSLTLPVAAAANDLYKEVRA